jgi:Icc protein
MSTLHITQITDLHLGASEQEILGGVNTFESFKAALQASEDQGRGDNLLLLTGDLASDYQAGAYQLLNKTLTEKAREALWLPGNHDNLESMEANLTAFPRVRIYQAGNWGMLLLDSSKEGQPGGHFSEAELAFAEQGLKELAGKFVLVAVHHSPVLVNSAWLDQQQIDNHQRLFELLVAHGQVKAVVTGHVHQHHDSLWGNIPVYSTPSSCVQFEQHSHDFGLADKPPGYRWLDLHEDGSLDTGVEFLKDFARQCDRSCAGY